MTLFAVSRFFLIRSFPLPDDGSADWKMALDQFFTFAETLFFLFAGILLALALRRYRKAFKENKSYQENKKIMCIIFFGAIGHILLEVAVTVFFTIHFRQGITYEDFDYTFDELCLATILCIGQFFFLYLLLNLAKKPESTLTKSQRTDASYKSTTSSHTV